jgi:hypothetical protein
VHADIEPGAAHRLARGRQAPHIAELAEDRRGGQLADPVMAHQRPATGLAAGQPAQPLLERGRAGGRAPRSSPATPRSAPEPRRAARARRGTRGPWRSAACRACPKHRGERALLGLAAARSCARRRASCAAVRGCATHARARAGSTPPAADPRRAACAGNAHPRGPSSRAASCPAARSSRPAPPDAGWRPPQPTPRTRTASPCRPRPRRGPPRPGTVPPTRGRPRCCANPAAVDLARPPIESVEGDLCSMHVEPGYDRHWGLLYSSTDVNSRESLALSGGGPGSCHLCAICGSCRVIPKAPGFIQAGAR